MCFQREREGIQVDLEGEVLEQAIQWMTRRNEKIHFYGGEPLLNMAAVKTILGTFSPTIQGKQGQAKRFSVTTNGTLVNREVYEWLKYHSCGVAFSFDGTEETMRSQRPGAYELVIENMPYLLELTTQVIKVMVKPETLIEDLEYIRGFGFKNVAVNFLKVYSGGYQDLELLEREYRKAIFTLHDPPSFQISEISRFTGFAAQKPSCGFVGSGLAIAPDGYIYPCIDAPLLGHEYAIGHVRTGVDPSREINIRKEARRPAQCEVCPGADQRPGGLCWPCPVNSCTYHGCFSSPVDPEHCEALLIQHRTIAEYAKKHPDKTGVRQSGGVTARARPAS